MNLIICMTPLQVLIAKKIIEDSESNGCIGIYMTYTDNKKHRHYYEVLKEFCESTSFILLDNRNSIQRLRTYYTIKNQYNKLELPDKVIKNIFFASIDTMFVQYVFSRINFNRLITFDDGTANIFQNSRYFIQQKQSLSKIIFRKLIGLKLSTIEDVKKLSTLHYSVYPDEKNIISNVKEVSLFNNKLNRDNDSNFKIKRIILGQPLDSFIGAGNYKNIVLKISKYLSVDYFFPHPRENVEFCEHLNVIDSELIIEDYLIKELEANPNLRFELYTFFSSSVLLIRNFERVSVNIVANDLLMEEFKKYYDFLENRGVKLIKLDNLS